MKLISSYVDGRDLVLLHQTPDGLRRRAVPASYDYFLRAADVNSVRGAVPDIPGWYRVSHRRWDDRKQQIADLTRRGIPTFEGDVSPIRRYISDHPEVSIAKPRRAFYDIETDSRVPFRDAREGAARVLCWCVRTGGETRTGMLEDDTPQAERALLRAFWTAVADADQLVGWNADTFDAPVLVARSKLLGCCPAYLQRWLWLDHMVAFRRMDLNNAEDGDSKQSMKLDDIGEAVVGHGKQPFDSSKTWEAWAEGFQGGREALLKYNIQDVILMEEIEQETGYLDLHEAVAQTTLVFPDSKGLRPIQQMDGFMMRLGPQIGQRLPSVDYDNPPPEYQFRGAYVMKPPRFKGIVEDVHVVDFASLYPSVVMSFNMSTETIDPNGSIRCPTVATRFRSDVRGMLPIAMEEMGNVRKKWRDLDKTLEVGSPEQTYAARMSMGAKVARNSFYGGATSRFGRYYSVALGEAITQTGAWLNRDVVIKEIEKRGWHPGYGDTDSALATGGTQEEWNQFVHHLNTEVFPPLLQEMGCPANHISLEYEKRFLRLVIPSAKKYAGIIETKSGTKLKFRGLELKRGDAGRLARLLQKEVVTQIVKDGVSDPAVVLETILRHRRHVLHDPLPVQDVQLSKSIRGSIDGYASQEIPHVRVARILRDRGREIVDGTRIFYVVTNGASSVYQNKDGGLRVIPAEDYKSEPPGNSQDCDRFHLWSRIVFPPTLRFIQAAFPDHDWGDLGDVRPKVTALARRYLKREQKGQMVIPGFSGLEYVRQQPERALNPSGSTPGLDR